MNEKPPNDPSKKNLRVEHMSDEKKHDEGEAPINVMKALLSGDLVFSEEDKQAKMLELAEAYALASTEERLRIEKEMLDLIYK